LIERSRGKGRWEGRNKKRFLTLIFYFSHCLGLGIRNAENLQIKITHIHTHRHTIMARR
jgi:hypothetical protein